MTRAEKEFFELAIRMRNDLKSWGDICAASRYVNANASFKNICRKYNIDPTDYIAPGKCKNEKGLTVRQQEVYDTGLRWRRRGYSWHDIGRYLGLTASSAKSYFYEAKRLYEKG